MRLSSVLCAAATLTVAQAQRKGGSSDERDEPIVRQGSTLLLNGKTWKAVGPNIYWLGLDENVIPPVGDPFYAKTNASYPTKGRVVEAMAVVKALGGTMIRTHTLGVSTGNPLSLMPKLGEINEKAFEPIDWAVYQAWVAGLRLMVPLTDNYDYYHGGKYNFLRWHGFNLTQADENNPKIQQFYTNATIIASFKDYIRTLVTHVNPYTNLSYADDPTIFAYETGNELLGPVWGDKNVPAEWVADIGQYVKTLAPKKLFVDGTYGVNHTHLNIPEVDIFSNHYYGPSTDKLEYDLESVSSVNKTYFAGEYDWVGGGDEPGSRVNLKTDAMAKWFEMMEKSPYVAGDAFWSLFGRNIPNCDTFVSHSDSFTLQYGNPANSVNVNSRIQLIRQHFTKMSTGKDIGANAPLPVVECPMIGKLKSRRRSFL